MDVIVIFGYALLFWGLLSYWSYRSVKKNPMKAYRSIIFGSIISVLSYMFVMIAPTIPYALELFYASLGLFNGTIIAFFTARRLKKNALMATKK